jgi:pyruvate ferredoxin oxidoreductase gamma subunit
LSNFVEIRWHGRGGQGAKTAALLLADAAFESGKFIQGFPEYGPERMGAPITAFNRVADEKIRIHSNIYEPNFVVVVDDTLLDSVDVTAGLKEDGAVVVNTHNPDAIRGKLRGYKGKVYAVDAREISISALGKYFPNFPMLGAIAKVSGVMEEEAFVSAMNGLIDKTFATKPTVVEGNKVALSRGMAEVKEVTQ